MALAMQNSVSNKDVSNKDIVYQEKSNITLVAKFKDTHVGSQTHISYLHSGDPKRPRLEHFISKVFKKYYNADIDQFYPSLLSIESDDSDPSNPDKAIKAIAGVRCASDEALFSEYYLSQSLETELTALYNKPISRQVVVEVGNLAPANVGQMRWLIAAITAFLYSAGHKYIVFTAVPGVFNAFRRMDVPLKEITPAKRSSLPEALKDKWGDEYYQAKPMVLAGDIAEGFAIMEENIYQSNKKLIPLFEEACRLGKQARLEMHIDGAVA